jgi:pyridoxine 5-phosphate synthase
MAISDEIIDIACKVKPHDVCLVPEKRQELTTEGGLDVLGNKHKLKDVVKKLKDNGICISIFIDPIEKQILASKEIGADAVELHTGTYANSLDKEKELKILKDASLIVLKHGLILNAGHGLDYDNVKQIAKISGMNELNIGHSIITKSIFVGLSKAVLDMKMLML